MPNVLITGANRGIGLELTKQYADDEWQVHATCRDPNRADALSTLGINVHSLDVRDINAISQLAKSITCPFDVVIANAGIACMENQSAQTFGQLDFSIWQDVLAVNTLGATATLEAFAPHLEQGQKRKMIAITSELGSIADSNGGYTAYRTSKAALNMAMMAAAPNLSRKGIAVGVLHPGWVQTDMGGPHAPLTPHDSAAGLRKVIDKLAPSEKAQFLTYDGSTLPW